VRLQVQFVSPNINQLVLGGVVADGYRRLAAIFISHCYGVFLMGLHG
jgi:hypothetical protein